MAATELSKSMNEFLTKLQDDLKEAMNTMMCTKCEGKHKYVATHPARSTEPVSNISSDKLKHYALHTSESCLVDFHHSCVSCMCVCRRFEMDREPAEARFCAECNRCHSAEEGDLWAESSMLGLRITYFACMDGKVYDITGERLLFLNSICCPHQSL